MKNHILPRLAAAALVAFSLSLLPACSSPTSVTSTWAAPDVSKISFKKIMVVATSPDGATRRAAEDAIKAQITRAECVTSYSVLAAESDLMDIAKVAAALKSAGVDGVVVLRPVADRSELSVTPGEIYPVPYRTFGGYYSRPYALRPFYQTPDRVTVDRIVQLETNIYEVAGGRLIWSAATTSTNPGQLQQLIAAATTAVRTELVKQKLIPQP